jgi:hypothetical protein
MNIYADAYEEAFHLKAIKLRKKLVKQEPWVMKRTNYFIHKER